VSWWCRRHSSELLQLTLAARRVTSFPFQRYSHEAKSKSGWVVVTRSSQAATQLLSFPSWRRGRHSLTVGEITLRPAGARKIYHLPSLYSSGFALKFEEWKSEVTVEELDQLGNEVNDVEVLADWIDRKHQVHAMASTRRRLSSRKIVEKTQCYRRAWSVYLSSAIEKVDALFHQHIYASRTHQKCIVKRLIEVVENKVNSRNRA